MLTSSVYACECLPSTTAFNGTALVIPQFYRTILLKCSGLSRRGQIQTAFHLPPHTLHTSIWYSLPLLLMSMHVIHCVLWRRCVGSNSLCLCASRFRDTNCILHMPIHILSTMEIGDLYYEYWIRTLPHENAVFCCVLVLRCLVFGQSHSIHMQHMQHMHSPTKQKMCARETTIIGNCSCENSFGSAMSDDVPGYDICRKWLQCVARRAREYQFGFRLETNTIQTHLDFLVRRSSRNWDELWQIGTNCGVNLSLDYIKLIKSSNLYRFSKTEYVGGPRIR